MSFIQNLFESVKKKQIELKERKDFVDMVESKAKPIRRAAYMQQMLKEVVNEGIQKAKEDAEKRKPKKVTEEKGFFNSLEDPYKFLNSKELDKKSKNKNYKEV